ncbi:Cell morphogenesis protein PAG1, partial [Kappamyces sp. JEL0680]
ASTSSRIKLAYCELFNELLEPVAKVADAEVNVPVWQRTIELITPQVMKMVTKAKSLNVVLPLTATLLTVSKKDYFLKNWPSLVEEIVPKFKERTLKDIALVSVCRLVWTYLFRCYDSPSSLVQKRTDWFVKVLFPSRRVVTPADCDLDVFVRICYYILVKYPEYGNEAVITHLLTSDIKGKIAGENDSFSINKSEGSLHLEEVPNADRLFIAFRSFILLLRDVEQSIGDKDDTLGFATTAGAVSAVQSTSGSGYVLVEGKINLKPPKFPSFERTSDYSFEYLQDIGTRENQNLRQRQFVNTAPLNTPLSKESQSRMGTSMRDTLQLVNLHLGQTFVSLDIVLGYRNLVEPAAPPNSNPYMQPTTSFSGTTSNPGLNQLRRPSTVVDTLNSFTGIPSRQEVFTVDMIEPKAPESQDQVYLRLLRTVIDTFPRCYPTGVPAIKVVEILSKFAGLHYDRSIQNAAFDALCRIAKAKRFDPHNSEWNVGGAGEMDSAGVYRIYNESIVKTLTSKYSELWHTGEKLDQAIVNSAERIIVLLDIWLEDISTASNYLPTIKDVKTIVETIESQGLIYLCSASPPMRKVGIEVLDKSRKFKTALMEKLPKDRVSRLKSAKSTGANSFERLSTFHAGTRASIYQRFSRKDLVADDKSATYISVYEIMVDQGLRIVRENYTDPLQSSVSRLELSELQKRQKLHQAALFSMDAPLLHVAQSTNDRDKALWDRCFTPLLKCLLEFANQETLRTCLSSIWTFLQAIQPELNSIAGEVTIYRAGFVPTVKKYEKHAAYTSASAVESLISYWKLYASFAYICIGVLKVKDDADPSDTDIDAKPFGKCSPAELNRNVLPLLSSEKHEIRKAAVASIGCIQKDSYLTLLRDIQPYIAAVVAESNSRIKRPPSTSETAFERMRTQLTHLLTFIANFTKEERYRKGSGMNSVLDYVRAMISYLSDPEVQLEWKHHITRYYFCTFIEKFYRYLIETLSGSDETIGLYITFHMRKVLFSLLEGWCGYGLDGDKSRQREANMMASVLETAKDISERAVMTNKMEVHRRSLQLVSLKTMASLCRGPLNAPSETGVDFNLARIVAWINGLLESPQVRYQQIARSAIANLVSHNFKSDDLMAEIFNNCYTYESSSNITIGYFLGFVDVLAKKAGGWTFPRSRLIALALFHLGSPNVSVRKGAGTLLQCLDQTQNAQVDASHALTQDIMEWYGGAKEDDVNFDVEEGTAMSGVEEGSVDPGMQHRKPAFEAVALSSSLATVYKKAQMQASTKLANESRDIAVEVVCEITFRIQSFNVSSDDDQKKIRNLLSIALPWLVETRFSGNFSLDRTSDLLEPERITWTLLNNLFFLTAKCIEYAPDEVEALWQATIKEASTQDAPFSVQQKMIRETLCTIVDYLALNIFNLQSSRAVVVAKNITVFLSRCSYGGILVQHILSKLTPDSLIPIPDSTVEKVRQRDWKPSAGLYFADLSHVVVPSTNSSKYSQCYLYLTLLVDATLEMDRNNFILHLPTLLTIILCQLDTSASRCEEMRTLLVNLIQSLLSKDANDRKRIDPILTALNLKVITHNSSAGGKEHVEVR